MDRPKRKNKIPKFLKFFMGYSLGFFSWYAGLHCLEVDAQGHVAISSQKWARHLLKVFLWTLEIGLVFNLLMLYRAWILSATVGQIEMAIFLKSIIFLYIKVFWPRFFPEILPGMHVFFCPQCYQRQTFRFQPVSFQFGFWVTYLCRYCSCLVNGWGEQIFYPVTVSRREISPLLIKLLPCVLLASTAGWWACRTLWNLF